MRCPCPPPSEADAQPPVIDDQRCWFCHDVARKPCGHVIYPVRLCRAHSEELETAVRADREAHPDNRCTDSCGCVSFDDLRAKYGLETE